LFIVYDSKLRYNTKSANAKLAGNRNKSVSEGNMAVKDLTPALSFGEGVD
jgi:hypothetical protein